MMHMRRARRPHLRHLHPLVLRNMCRRNLVRVFHFPPRRNLHRPGHLDHQIRLRNIPPFTPGPRSRCVAQISRRRSRFLPSRNRSNLLRTQRWIVGETSIPRIGKPGRHHLHLHRTRNFCRPRPRLFISHQRHRCSFPAPVAVLALILEDRNHILIEGRWRSPLARCGTGTRHLPERSHQHHRQPRREKNPKFLHERKNSKVSAHACPAECGSYDPRSSQKNPWSARENSTFT
jgi:hypothetical protein